VIGWGAVGKDKSSRSKRGGGSGMLNAASRVCGLRSEVLQDNLRTGERWRQSDTRSSMR